MGNDLREGCFVNSYLTGSFSVGYYYIMDGFQKLDLSKEAPIGNSSSSPLSQPMAKIKKKFKLNSRKNIIIASVLCLLILFGIFGILIPGIGVAKQALKTATVAKIALAGLKQQNIQVASDQLAATKVELTKTEQKLSAMGYLRFIPPINFYYNDALHLVKAGGYGLNAGEILVEAVKPYADVLGLKGQGSFVMGSAQDRIQTAVTTMSKVTPKIDDIEKELVLARAEIDQVNPNHYPSIFGGQKINDTLKQVKTVTDESVSFIQQAKPLIKVLPSLLGEPTTKRYLVLFQNDKELRPTGGFITAYAIFRLEHGVIKVDTSNDIYNLDATISNKPAAPRPIALYLPKVNEWNLRDTNLSPDFVVSMEDFNKLYKRAGGYEQVDGIITVDTHTLVAAMNILGDIQADGTTFTTKQNAICKCPDVIYQLEVYADQPVNYVKTNRKGIVGDLMYAIMQKAFSSSPKQYWGPLFQTMITEVSQKHMLFDIYNTDAQSGLEALNAAGRIQNFEGDYLHVNDTNFGGAKSNLFLTEAVTSSYQTQSDGSIVKTVTISYKNPFAPSDCSLLSGGLCLNAIQRDWLRVYVPKGSTLMDSKGSEVKVTSYDELGKTVFEGFLTIRPLGSATYTLKYKLPFKVAGSDLPLLIQKQPGTNDNQYTIEVNGRKVEDFPLLTDKTLKLSIH